MSILGRVRGALFGVSRNLSPGEKEAVRNSIAEKIANPETTNELLSEIKKLAGRAASVDEAFRSVRSGLKTLDGEHLEDKNGTPIPKFHLRWVEFQKVSLSYSEQRHHLTSILTPVLDQAPPRLL